MWYLRIYLLLVYVVLVLLLLLSRCSIDVEQHIEVDDEPELEEPAPEPAPEPTPEPTPVTQPVPVPAPQPIQQPTPAPQPEPEPQPAPVPEPQPQPQPEPAPQPAPTPAPAPQPVVQPTPTPTPQPAPQPPMGDPRNYGGMGKLKITLLWDFYGDIDLHVVEPSGNTIFHRKKIGDTGGRLDIDRTTGGVGSAENIYWADVPPSGDYKVYLHFYRKSSNQEPSSGICRVYVFKDGVQVGAYDKMMQTQNEKQLVTIVHVP